MEANFIKTNWRFTVPEWFAVYQNAQKLCIIKLPLNIHKTTRSLNKKDRTLRDYQSINQLDNS